MVDIMLIPRLNVRRSTFAPGNGKPQKIGTPHTTYYLPFYLYTYVLFAFHLILTLSKIILMISTVCRSLSRKITTILIFDFQTPQNVS
jgi:hypothetical protein